MSPTTRATIAPLALLLSATAATPTSLPAADAPAEPTVERQLLILTGGTDATTVEQWKTDHRAALADLYPDPDALPLISSDGIAGLQPGFVVLAPAVCPAETAADAFYAALHEIPGAYVRTVQVPEDFGTCRTAKTTAWSTLTLRPSGDWCEVVRAPLAPEPYYYGDPNVIPPPPEGTVMLETIGAPCPQWWSATRSESGRQLLINFHGGQTLQSATRAYLLDLGRTEGFANLVDPGGELESVHFDSETVVVSFLDRQVTQLPAEASGQDQPELVYTGSLEQLFARWKLTDRTVQSLDQTEVRRTVPGEAVALFACIEAHGEGKTWVERKRQLIASTEGSLPPYCTAPPSTHNLGFTDATLKGRPVQEGLAAEFSQAVGAEAGTRWTFVGMSGVGGGDLAVSTHTELGSSLTGHVVAYDGETARPLKGLRGKIWNLTDLDHGRVLVCTDKGYGVYQARTGAQLWREGIKLCPVVMRD